MQKPNTIPPARLSGGLTALSGYAGISAARLAVVLSVGTNRSAYSAASTLRGGVCTTGANSGALNDDDRRSLDTRRYSVSR